jgi:SAM-dependent methyltransferase
VTSTTDGSGSSPLPAPLPEGTDWRALNRANWDARVPIHAASRFYDIPGFVGGRSTLRDFELAEVGDVSGRTLLHLQCHIGPDTLSWARLGATVTGLDFSGPALETARSIAAQIGVTDARFVESDVYDAATALEGRTFDIVYTGLGALCWLPDVERWARTAASLVAPGGFLYLAEFHPFSDILADDGKTVELDYFTTDPRVWTEGETYTDYTAEAAGDSAPGSTDGVPLSEHTVSVDWQHGLGDVVSALIAADLRIELLHEHDYTLFPRFPHLLVDGDRHTLPPDQPRVPLIYSVRASKPA